MLRSIIAFIAATVAKPVTMKVAVATIERGESRLTPHTPWPLVQPLAMTEPMPTIRPARTTAQTGRCKLESSEPGTSHCIRAPPTASPPTKASRQAQSPGRGASRPLEIPLTPAMRPLKSSMMAAAKPINMPPATAIHDIEFTCCFLLMTRRLYPADP